MSNKRTGQDFIDYYEEKEKTTMSEKARYTKEKAKQRKKALQEAMNN